MADNSADTDWVDCNALRRDAQTGRDGDSEQSAGGLTALSAYSASNDNEWHPRLRLIEPDGTEVAVPSRFARTLEPADQQAAAAEARANAEAEAAARQEAEAKTKREAEARAKAEAEEKARAAAQAKAKAAEEERQRAEAQAAEEQRKKAAAKARREAEAKARAEAEAKARALEEAREVAHAKAAAEARAKKEAAEKAREAAEEKAAKEKAKREAKRRAEAEARAKAEAEAEAKRKAEAEAKAKAKAEAAKRAKEEAEKQAKAEAEKKAKADAKRKAEAETKRKAEAEAKAAAEAMATAKAEAEAQAKEAAEARAKQEADEKAQEADEAEDSTQSVSHPVPGPGEVEDAPDGEPPAEADAPAPTPAPAKSRKDRQPKPADLTKTFRRLIRETGPISLAQYMGESNARYYASRDPLGDDGDFITAPEVSQMFGELVGLWFADLWVKMGSRKHIHYVELGPGRGTLSSDALRTARRYEFEPQVHFVEASPALRKIQKKAHPGAIHHDDLSTLPDDAPLLIVANEFFDALPIHQLIRSAQGWHERMIGLEDNRLAFVAGDKPMDAIVPSSWRSAAQGTMIEAGTAGSALMAEIATRLKDQGGAALIIDYGPLESRSGSTLQAIKAHKKVDPLSHPGQADLTAHVDFETLREVAEKNGADVMGLQMQGEWLHQMGIEVRHEALLRKAPDMADQLKRQYNRLVADDQMGTLFKVLGICGRRWPFGVGFD